MIFNVSGGGGAALNFKVLAYATEEELLAATPAENTIGVVTTTPISSWVFSVTEPSPAVAGMVWIATGTNSTMAFNALKKNNITVYPLSVKQYVSGTWVDKELLTFQGGSWISMIPYLYRNGNQCVTLTGGWRARAWAASSYATAAAPTLTRNSTNMVGSLTAPSDSLLSGVVECVNDIDLTDYNSIKIECSATGWAGASLEGVVLSVCDRTGTHIIDNISARLDILPAGTDSVSRAVRELDVSNVMGKWDVCLTIIAREGRTSSVTVYNI